VDTTVDDSIVGQTLDGRYRVDSRIARGGMATVYLGHDIRLDRRIALKVMHPSMASDEDFVRRFIDEAKSVARLSHPNIVAVYDQGADAGHVFLAMEYVPGQTLRDLLRRRGALRPREALELLVPVLGGLAAAHHAGLVHRDIKPENVLITEDGRVKVVDFGLARAVESSTHHTKTGMIIGTVGYLAPEQVVQGIADARSDVYAAGVMLFELLTGRQPHRGDTPLSVAYKHVNEVVPAPSRLMTGVPQPLDTLVAMATSRDPDLRPGDAGQFLHAIFEALRTLPADGAAPMPRPVPVDDPGADMHTESIQQANHTLVAPRPEMPERPPADAGRGGGHRGSHRERGPGRWYTSRPLTVVVCAVVVVAVLAGVGWWVMIGRWADVPKLAGMSVTDARTRATHDGFGVRIGAGRYDDTVPAGKIVATSPNQGGKIAHDGTITLFPSKGPETVAIPDVANKPMDQARQALRGAGLQIGQIRRESNPNVPKDTVEGTDPPAGTQQPVTQAVTLVVSTGIAVPDLRDQNVNDAATNLTNVGLTMSRVDKYSSQPADTVIGQHPRPGSGANRGDVVQVIVSKGPPVVPIPDLGGKSVEDATKILQDAGFTVTANRIMNGDKVFKWDPSGQAPKGSQITLWAGP
jgi:serine/threonine-protein kinase